MAEKIKKYVWAPGRRITIAPDVAAKALEKIKKKHKRLTALAVVTEAKNKRNPLHPFFEWDDAVAGLQFRLVQARFLIRSLRIEYVNDGGPKRYYLHIQRPDSESEYETKTTILADEDLRLQALRDCLASLRGWAERFGEIAEIEKIAEGPIRELEKLIEKEEKQRRKKE